MTYAMANFLCPVSAVTMVRIGVITPCSQLSDYPLPRLILFPAAVECPVCGLLVLEKAVNSHLDVCLARMTKPPSNPG